jgi:hypothetical protein
MAFRSTLGLHVSTRARYGLCLLLVGCSATGGAKSSHGSGSAGTFDNAPPPLSGAGVYGFADNPGGFAGQTGLGSTHPTGGGAAIGCKGLQCQQHTCPSGTTTISGHVYDPAGKNPLYNVAVYVPNEKPDALTFGASCAKCDSLYTGKPVVTSVTDAQGHFVIKDAPDGANIPLVVQIGKWRKQFVVPNVAACQDTAVPDHTLGLPRNHTEGDIPNIAISTGAADTLECLLRRIGVDASEYVPGAGGDGRIHIFQGSPGNGSRGGSSTAPNTPAPGAPSAPMALWPSADELKKYDIVLLSCEGDETKAMNQQALHDYASAGGRVFASHFHYAWFNSGPYGMENLATWTTGSNSIGNIGGTVVTSFPKGQALKDWLMNTNALNAQGELPIEQARHNADVSTTNIVSQPWILPDAQAMQPANATQYFSFNTPTNAGMTPDGPAYCGRVVYSDLHVGAASNDNPKMPVPAECSNVNLSPQEKALEFMLFDLSACVTPDDRPPVAPPVLK